MKNDKWVQERIKLCKDASKQLDKVRKRFRKVVKEVMLLHRSVTGK